MKILIWVSLLSACLFSTVLLSEEDGKGAKTQDQSNCVTHTVRNETTGVTNVITNCSSGESVSDLVHDKPEPKKADNRSKGKVDWFWQKLDVVDDLDAQTSMSDSTYWIMLFSFGSLIISGAGLGYLIRTVNQNKITFVHIKQSSALELRGYLKVSEPAVWNMYWENMADNEIGIICHAKIQNIGKTPIRNIQSPVPTWCDFRLANLPQGVLKSTIGHPKSDVIPIINPEDVKDINFTVTFRGPERSSGFYMGHWDPEQRLDKARHHSSVSFRIRARIDYEVIGSGKETLRTCHIEFTEKMEISDGRDLGLRLVAETERSQAESNAAPQTQS